jgi:hypothetical protein
LIYVTSTLRDATSSDIADYNAFVQADADAEGIGGVTWSVLGSTATVNAIDNAVITGPVFNIYLSGFIAVDAADLWDLKFPEPGATISTIAGASKEAWTGTGDGGVALRPFGGTPNVEYDWTGWRDWVGAQKNGPATDLREMVALSDPLVIGGGGPTNISPEDGSTVPVGNVELLWENMDPNFAGGSVYVDVWFGTDPDPKNGTKVVDAGENTTTVQVSAPTEGTYYWQVGNYVYGSATGDPCEGDVWSFNAVADLPPSSVDAGVDMITWSGQAVQLDPNVVDDGQSALTYLWTAVPADGVVFAPSASVEDPTVTITKDAPTGDATTVTVTLTVNDAANPTTFVDDTMTIDVYDDACKAALGKGLDPIGPADFDANCITDLRDYAVLAATWLVDYKLTKAAIKP